MAGMTHALFSDICRKMLPGGGYYTTKNQITFILRKVVYRSGNRSPFSNSLFNSRQEMKKLRAMSDARVPPTDERGYILPPLEYRRLQAQGRIKHMPNYFDNR